MGAARLQVGARLFVGARLCVTERNALLRARSLEADRPIEAEDLDALERAERGNDELFEVAVPVVFQARDGHRETVGVRSREDERPSQTAKNSRLRPVVRFPSSSTRLDDVQMIEIHRERILVAPGRGIDSAHDRDTRGGLLLVRTVKTRQSRPRPTTVADEI